MFNRIPFTWFVVSDCKVSGSGCTGLLYKVTGGTSLTQPWVGPVNTPSVVGSLTFNFTDEDSGTLVVELNGSTVTKTITRQPIANDTDSDGISNRKDNCPEIANADQQDTDSNGTGDVCEL